MSIKKYKENTVMLWPILFGANQKPDLRLWRRQAGLDHVKYKAVYRIIWNCRNIYI